MEVDMYHGMNRDRPLGIAHYHTTPDIKEGGMMELTTVFNTIDYRVYTIFVRRQVSGNWVITEQFRPTEIGTFPKYPGTFFYFDEESAKKEAERLLYAWEAADRLSPGDHAKNA